MMKNEIVKTQGMSKGYKVNKVEMTYILLISVVNSHDLDYTFYDSEFTIGVPLDEVIKPIELLTLNIARYFPEQLVYAHVKSGKDCLYEFRCSIGKDYQQTSFRNFVKGGQAIA